MTTAQHVLRKQRIRDCVFVGLDRHGLEPIKIVELWSKWGPLIKDSVERNLLCPKPSDAIIALVKGDRAAKAAGKITKALALSEDGSYSLCASTVYVPPDKPMKNGL